MAWQDEGCWGGGDGRDGGVVGGEGFAVTPQLVTAFTS